MVILVLVLMSVSVAKAQFIENVNSSYITFYGGIKVAVDVVPFGQHVQCGKMLPLAIADAVKVRRQYYGSDFIGFGQELAFEMSKMASLKRILAASTNAAAKSSYRPDSTGHKYTQSAHAAAKNTQQNTQKNDTISDGNDYSTGF